MSKFEAFLLPFGPMKGGLCGQHFPHNNAIITGVGKGVTLADADFYEHSVQPLVYCWLKCIANGGDYVEK